MDILIGKTDRCSDHGQFIIVLRCVTGLLRQLTPRTMQRVFPHHVELPRRNLESHLPDGIAELTHQDDIAVG